MLLGSLFLYLIWPLIVVAGYVISNWALHKFESNVKAAEK